MKTVVLGSGGWGTALSQVLCDNGHDVTLWSHNPDKAAAMAESPGKSSAPGCAPAGCSAHYRRPCLSGRGGDGGVRLTVLRCAQTGRKAAPYLRPETVLVSVSKGIERDTNLRMSQILQEETKNICKVVALSGPSHAEEVGVRMPTAACPPAWTGLRRGLSRTPL